ncbi:hypothetical protein K7A41_19790 [Sphingobacterium sp. InxBP1]|uniref:hypothetical protein n=1 Tax=Sphingobacterium sp. InxBP1 TaxID=2870328 RepID=UPI002243B5B5|nr:hypothetical protein [Sphingobacterium sp. InxBP1]MCW8313479.1 hypothetical protein [Sphingobacterium sp. InxBP1]
MKKILNKIGRLLQVVLTAPVKLPAKAVNVLKYLALGLGILETVIDEEKPPPEQQGQRGQSAERMEASVRNRPAGASTDKGGAALQATGGAAAQAAGDESGQLDVTAHDDAGGPGERSGGDEGE